MAIRSEAEYWEQVKKLPVYEQKGTGSDNYHPVLVVDWSTVFAGTSRDSASWVLGYDPVGQSWVNSGAQYWTMSYYTNWVTTGRIDSLESRVSKLEKK